MRHFIAGAVLVVAALMVTFGVATMLQSKATHTVQNQEVYTPPALKSPGAKSKGESSRVMVSRRMNDEQVNDRSEETNE
jgi:hypothetical protein